MKKIVSVIVIVFVVCAFSGCNNDVEKSVAPQNTDRDYFPSFVNINYELDGVLDLSGIRDVHPAITAVFDKYTNITAPNGKQIHLVGQDGVSRTKLARARNIMIHFLTDYPDGQFGNNKGLIANAMADTGAVLLYFNSEIDMEVAMAGELGDLDLASEYLNSDESVVEGDYDYLNNTIQDRSYEKIFHLVHEFGIYKVIPEYNDMINNAMEVAIQNRLWVPDLALYDKWLAEGQLGKEYITRRIDVYYGLWGHDDSHIIYDSHRPNGVEALEKNDQYGVNAVEAFMHPYFTQEVYLDESFDGTFRILPHNGINYTHKSRYIKNITLTGSNDQSVYGNGLDNVYTGNSGNNTFISGELDPMGGISCGLDTLKYMGNIEEYTLFHCDWYEGENSVWKITDSIIGRNGIDSTGSIEVLTFNGVPFNLVRIW